MQPTLRQTPPQYCFSTTATFLPSWPRGSPPRSLGSGTEHNDIEISHGDSLSGRLLATSPSGLTGGVVAVTHGSLARTLARQRGDRLVDIETGDLEQVDDDGTKLREDGLRDEVVGAGRPDVATATSRTAFRATSGLRSPRGRGR